LWYANAKLIFPKGAGCRQAFHFGNRGSTATAENAVEFPHQLPDMRSLNMAPSRAVDGGIPRAGPRGTRLSAMMWWKSLPLFAQ
jgi:hypothetical protein